MVQSDYISNRNDISYTGNLKKQMQDSKTYLG